MAVLGRQYFPKLRAVVLDSTFYSYRSIVRDKIGAMPLLKYFKWPLSFLVVGNAWSGGPVVDQIAPVPLRIYHGTDDHIIPVHHAEWIYQHARSPKEKVIIPGGYHVDLFLRYGDRYQKEVTEFFRDALAMPTAPAP